MTQLPVPELEATLTRFIEWLSPIAEDKMLAASKVAAETFAQGDGRVLQEKLQAFAADRAPDSWLIEAWRARNLANRDSLPLSSNIAMRIAWQATQTGRKRVAHFVNALLQVHADYRRNGSIAAINPRGEELCCEQQRILLGASRRPGVNGDQFIFNDAENASGHIVILCKGYAWRIEVIDERGGVATPAQIDNALHDILVAHEQEAEIAFGAPSVLPSDDASEIRAQLICRDDNSRAWQCVERALFVLSLDGTHHNDSDGALNDALFNSNGLWAYKPLNYICYLNDDRYYIHFEHTWTDAGTIADIIACAQAHYDADDCPRKNKLSADLDLKALEWQIGEQTRLILKEQLAEYARRAETLRISHKEIIISEEDREKLSGISKDALCQMLLQYAQYAAFGRIRSTYESVDMRHFPNGRTECLRPVSDASVAFIHALYDGRATLKQLSEAINEHKKRVKACKRGEGVHRHLLGLANVADEQGLDVPFFADPGYQLLAHDFFSTTSLGTHQTIGHIAFAPSMKDGFGINYAVTRNHLSFVFMYKRSNSEYVTTLINELDCGLKRLLLLLRN